MQTVCYRSAFGSMVLVLAITAVVAVVFRCILVYLLQYVQRKITLFGCKYNLSLYSYSGMLVIAVVKTREQAHKYNGNTTHDCAYNACTAEFRQTSN